MTSVREIPRVRALLGWVLPLALLCWGFVQGAGAPSIPADPTIDRELVAGDAVTVFLLRHAEKGDDDPRNPSLSTAGQRRASELARLLEASGVTHLLSTNYKRTLQTLAPLATASGIEIVTYDPRRPLEALKQLPPGSTAVVCGHSNTTPSLYAALGAGDGEGLEDSKYGRVIPEDAYDRLYCLALLPKQQGGFDFVSGYELRYGEPSAH